MTIEPTIEPTYTCYRCGSMKNLSALTEIVIGKLSHKLVCKDGCRTTLAYLESIWAHETKLRR